MAFLGFCNGFLQMTPMIDEEEQELKLKHPKVYRIVKMELLAEELTKERRDLCYEEALSVMKSFMKHRGGLLTQCMSCIWVFLKETTID